jgi:hypothetical protein
MESGDVNPTYVDHFSNGIEQPPVRVDFLLILCLQNQNNLDGDQVVLVTWLRQYQLRCGVYRQLGGILLADLIDDDIDGDDDRWLNLDAARH